MKELQVKLRSGPTQFSGPALFFHVWLEVLTVLSHRIAPWTPLMSSFFADDCQSAFIKLSLLGAPRRGTVHTRLARSLSPH